MGQHVTLNLGEQELQRAQAAAAELGVELETYLERLIAWHVAPANREDNSGIASMFGLIPASAGEPTDIARDKDRLIGEAVLHRLRRLRKLQIIFFSECAIAIRS